MTRPARRPPPALRVALPLVALALLVSTTAATLGAQTPAPASPTTAPPAPSAADRAREERLRNDWAWLARYRAANDSLGAPAAGTRRVVFMGNSITEGLAPRFAALFPG